MDPVRAYESFGFLVQMFFAYQEGGGPGDLATFIEHERHRMAARAAWSRYA